MVCGYALRISYTKINHPVVKHENFMLAGKIPFPSCTHLNLYAQASKTDQSARNTNIPRMGLSGLPEIRPHFKTAKGRWGSCH